MLSPQLRILGRFNRWANRKVYAAVAGLTDAEYRADRGAFFRSTHRTLNHILVGDRLWLRRLTGSGDQPSSLDAILYDDFPSLQAAREREDERIVAYVDRLEEDALDCPCAFTNVAGEAFTFALGPLIINMFNHATHHRGQVHGILTGLGKESLALDLFIYLREAGA